ncbi:hypothetical protein M0802_003341 [Mischocyttarus mexicanus]|nr:hypothetical protein M0802_003341 [Mischocyttarus mexicanus]
MTRHGRLLLLLTLLMAYGLLAVESRYREDSALEPRRHRHRHRHETSVSKRNHHEPVNRRSSSWSRELDYDEYDDLNEDSREEDDGYESDDEDYEGIRSYEERLYPRSRGKSYQERIHESRYPRRYRENYYGWYHDEEKRRIPSRYNWKNRHRSRLERLGRNRHRGITGGTGGGGGSGGVGGSEGGSSYSRNHEAFRDDFSEENDEDEDERSARRYEDDTRSDNHYTSSSSYPTWRNSKKHRNNWRRDWRGNRLSSIGYRYGKKYYDASDLDGTRKFRLEDQRRRRTNLTEKIFKDYVESEKEEKEEKEEDDIWKEAEKEEEEDDDGRTENIDDDVVDGELDNDFYKNENKPPLNGYDDIIRRLTSEDPSTAKPTVKRDYRNVDIEKYPLRVSYNTNNSGSRNLTRPKVVGSSYVVVVNKMPSKGEEVVDKRAPMIKSASAEIERKPTKNVISVVVKDDDEHSGKAKTKSLEQEYDDYLNTEDNEKEEDLIKAGVDDDSGMQSDVNNTDYNDNETTDNHKSTSTTTTTTSTTTTSSTTTTTTTPKPTLTQQFDYRDSRAYDSGTGAQYNGYQGKNDYPPMSAHSVHKWQSLGTREGVKETRSNMQQFNKNGKTAIINDILQHAMKVSKEGNCQWPRPRVIPVRDVYPSPSTTYIPHCAILHRCSDDTGCCRSEALTCVPKHSHRVELSFYFLDRTLEIRATFVHVKPEEEKDDVSRIVHSSVGSNDSTTGGSESGPTIP